MIRRDTDAALRMLVGLATRPGETVSASQLARQSEVPKSFALKILGQLAVAGILSARQGRGGGFRLAHELRDVSMLRVVEAVQGPPWLNRCMAGEGLCAREDGCPVSAKLRAIQKQLDRLLGETTLADIVPRKAKAALKRRSRRESGGNRRDQGCERGVAL
jgi:Rrf2 family protein